MLGKKMKLKTNRIKATFLKTQQQPKKKKNHDKSSYFNSISCTIYMWSFSNNKRLKTNFVKKSLNTPHNILRKQDQGKVNMLTIN